MMSFRFQILVDWLGKSHSITIWRRQTAIRPAAAKKKAGRKACFRIIKKHDVDHAVGSGIIARTRHLVRQP
jgi:hypothetical protein